MDSGAQEKRNYSKQGNNQTEAREEAANQGSRYLALAGEQDLNIESFEEGIKKVTVRSHGQKEIGQSTLPGSKKSNDKKAQNQGPGPQQSKKGKGKAGPQTNMPQTNEFGLKTKTKPNSLGVGPSTSNPVFMHTNPTFNSELSPRGTDAGERSIAESLAAGKFKVQPVSGGLDPTKNSAVALVDPTTESMGARVRTANNKVKIGGKSVGSNLKVASVESAKMKRSTGRKNPPSTTGQPRAKAGGQPIVAEAIAALVDSLTDRGQEENMLGNIMDQPMPLADGRNGSTSQ